MNKIYIFITILFFIFFSFVPLAVLAKKNDITLEQLGITPTADGFAFTTDTQNGVLNQAPPTEQPNTYYRAKVARVTAFGSDVMDGHMQDWQTLDLELLTGADKGRHIVVNNGKDYVVGTYQKYSEGEVVVVARPAQMEGQDQETFYIVDKYRNPQLIIVALLFFGLAVYFGRKRGITSVVGMLFSVLIIFYYIIPHIVSGSNPLVICMVGAAIIVLLSLYLSHGFNKRTTIALLSTLVSLTLAAIIDVIFVYIVKLSGNGTEESFYLQFGGLNINLRGLLLGSIIIGVLGVLDDVTTGQTAAIEEIYDANSSLTFTQLYHKGLSVGREHIASLINTLVLAYAGASFPLLLLYSTQKLQPVWVIINSNFIAEEIVRTLVGSAVLVIAVPLTTFLAAYFYSRKKAPTKLMYAQQLSAQEMARSSEMLRTFWNNKK